MLFVNRPIRARCHQQNKNKEEGGEETAADESNQVHNRRYSYGEKSAEKYRRSLPKSQSEHINISAFSQKSLQNGKQQQQRSEKVEPQGLKLSFSVRSSLNFSSQSSTRRRQIDSGFEKNGGRVGSLSFPRSRSNRQLPKFYEKVEEVIFWRKSVFCNKNLKSPGLYVRFLGGRQFLELLILTKSISF